MTTKRALLGIGVSLGVAVVIGGAGSDGSVTWAGLPLFAVCGLVAFAVHWAIFLPSFVYRTEHYFDLTGMIANLSVVSVALVGLPSWNPRSLILGLLIAVWTLRLGLFLFLRIRRAGKDDRFDDLKQRFAPFFMTWTLSGLWVYLTAAAALAAMTSTEPLPLGGFALVGGILWLLGFSIETIADGQKFRHRANSENAGAFISEGLWAWSRHPNYFGEIVLWFGVALIAFPVLSGWQYVTLVSPVFVWLLLTRISGIPLLEAKAKEKWGDDPAYRAYEMKTPVLIPRPPK